MLTMHMAVFNAKDLADRGKFGNVLTFSSRPDSYQPRMTDRAIEGPVDKDFRRTSHLTGLHVPEQNFHHMDHL